jgi:ubiquinone/menaquinone biosynthesis C-methylase UbiE
MSHHESERRSDPCAGATTPGRARIHVGGMTDPLAGSPWSAPATVAGFATSPPNETLMRFAAGELARVPGGHAIDIGCGAGRNAVPLAEQGWVVLGTDWSLPMIEAAAPRAAGLSVGGRLHVALAPMDALPAEDQAFDLVIAHGIWNLAASAAEFRRGVAEAARVARPGAGLFVFTFSRHTLPLAVQPIAGEPFVFTEFSGRPQVFLTEEQLRSELAAAGFVADAAVPLTEHNRPKAGALHAGRTPVIYEATFRKL